MPHTPESPQPERKAIAREMQPAGRPGREDITDTMNMEKVERQIPEIVNADLYQRFPAGFVFDPIRVYPRTAHMGDKYLKVFVIYQGNTEDLDPAKTFGLITRTGKPGPETLQTRTTVPRRENRRDMRLQANRTHAFRPPDEKGRRAARTRARTASGQ